MWVRHPLGWGWSLINTQRAPVYSRFFPELVYCPTVVETTEHMTQTPALRHPPPRACITSIRVFGRTLVGKDCISWVPCCSFVCRTSALLSPVITGLLGAFRSLESSFFFFISPRPFDQVEYPGWGASSISLACSS